MVTPVPLGDDGGHAQGQRRGESALRVVPDGVARAADALHLLQAEAGAVGDLAGGGRESFAEQAVQQGELPRLARPRADRPQDQVAQLLAVGLAQRLDQAGAEAQADALDLQECGVHPVGTRARRQADDPARGHVISPRSSRGEYNGSQRAGNKAV